MFLPSRIAETARFRRRLTSGWSGVLAAVLALLSSLSAAELGDPAKLPPAANVKIDFDQHIKPIFEAACFRCHGTERPKSKFSLVTRESALKGGNEGVDIVPGQSAKSPLIHYVARLVPDMEMPPTNVGIVLSAEQVGLLRAWIDQGVVWSAQGALGPKPPAFTASPSLRGIAVQGNVSKYRELYWAKEGVYGGVDDFRFQENLGANRSLSIQGHAVPVLNDFKLDMTLEQKELGFARFNFEDFRRYYSDAGGYYPPLGIPPYALNQGLYLDVGKVSMDLGLTIPDVPRVVLGYEYDFGHGAKSTLEWGQVFDSAGNPHNIYPAAKDIDERTHIVKLDISHQIQGVTLEDNFRGEFYSLDTQQANVDTFQLGKSGPDKVVLIHQGESHWQGANAFRVEKQFNDWLFGSAGYLFSHLDGTALFNLTTALTPNAVLPPVTTFGFDDFWSSRQVLLDQQSHVFNANLMLEPLKGLTFSGGVQNEWRTQHGFGDVRVDQGDPTNPAAYLAQPALLHSDLDTFSTDESFGVRYHQIPLTVLYADTHFQQSLMGSYQEQAGGLHDFLQNTDVTDDLKEYRAGFNFSPWSAVALNAYYKHRDKQTDYDYRTDLTRFYADLSNPIAVIGTAPNDGYPGFILRRQIVSDEVGSKLILRWTSWLKSTLGYALTATDYRTDTKSAAGGLAPGGALDAGKYTAHTVSLNNTLTPWRRFFLNTTFSLSDSRTRTAQNGILDVVPYQGEVYSVLASANYVLTQTTDWQVAYSFSHADYGADQTFTGLPLGMVFDWHGVQTSVSRHFKHDLTIRLTYGYSYYNEPSSGQYNNFKAHAVFATLTKVIP